MTHYLKKNIPLQALHTFGVEAFAEYYFDIHTLEDLDTILRNYPEIPQPVLCLGGGSNIIFRQHYAGTVLAMRLMGISIIEETDDTVTVRCAAGEQWHSLVEWTVNQGWSGIENLALIPGTCGAAPIQNIGAYGMEIKETIIAVEWYDFVSGQKNIFTNEQCHFEYRDSIFKKELANKGIITAITLQLSKKPDIRTSYADIRRILEEKHITEPTVRTIFDAVVEIRTRKLPNPKEYGNAGSFFKNPVISIEHFRNLQQSYPEIPHYPIDDITVKVPAGWLIEKAGWKGFRRGDIGVSPKQALVLINYGKAHTEEIIALANDIVQDIQQRFSITLEREVSII